uniref:PSME3-interacting protein n=1 Tax=Elaeis guineensis var. tenera TaxID=51953 RepID=A0A6I9QSZ8_ELAGV|nr:PSME3-interacting protein [Elaeis guineensis]
MDHDNADAAAAAAPPIRLVNFISEEELDQAKKTRGERVDDGTAQRDKPLYEILKENKDRKDAEFNERFKHRPPKALDEDETEFLDNLEMSRRKYERQLADEEAQQLRSFQDAVAARSSIVHELKETPAIARAEEKKPVAKRSQDARPGHLIISVKPQAKKAKIDAKSDKSSVTDGSSNGQVDEKPPDVASVKAVGGLVSYSDESDDD